MTGVQTCALPILVDVGSMTSAVIFGIVLSVLAILSKVLGSGIPALVTGFNFLGSARIGVGMTPRGEVALIIAGIGLSQGIIGQNLDRKSTRLNSSHW